MNLLWFPSEVNTSNCFSFLNGKQWESIFELDRKLRKWEFLLHDTMEGPVQIHLKLQRSNLFGQVCVVPSIILSSATFPYWQTKGHTGIYVDFLKDFSGSQYFFTFDRIFNSIRKSLTTFCYCRTQACVGRDPNGEQGSDAEKEAISRLHSCLYS